MKICIINGSPKGKYSVTLQTALYLEKRFPSHSFEVIDVGQRIRALEKGCDEVMSLIAAADAVLFSYPVYTFLAPSQLHRFIELMKASGVDFSGKFATQITTSKHFYDVTAHRYIEDNCRDMGMKVVHGLSADMEDLLTEKGQADAVSFFEYFEFCVNSDVYEKLPTSGAQKPESAPSFAALSDSENAHNENQGACGKDGQSHDTVIVADLKADDEKLKAEIDAFTAAYPFKTRLINIAEYPIQGGCLGCFRCASQGKCVYTDGFDRFLREEIQTADAIVYAFTVRDHSMGARFKMYDDRQFCNGHRTVTEGTPFCYIVNGALDGEENLRTVIEARCEVGHNFLCGIGNDGETLGNAAKRLAYAVEHRYVQPRNFYGVGGMKIFRDLIWLMRGLMKADHDFYKKHGVYDFPQKKRGAMIKMCFLGVLVRNPKVSAKMGNKMNEAMVAPYKKIIGGGCH